MLLTDSYLTLESQIYTAIEGMINSATQAFPSDILPVLTSCHNKSMRLYFLTSKCCPMEECILNTEVYHKNKSSNV